MNISEPLFHSSVLIGTFFHTNDVRTIFSFKSIFFYGKLTIGNAIKSTLCDSVIQLSVYKNAHLQKPADPLGDIKVICIIRPKNRFIHAISTSY